MYKYILESAGNINWMALFALVTFFIIFGTAVYMAFMKDKEQVKHMAELPLMDDDPEGVK